MKLILEITELTPGQLRVNIDCPSQQTSEKAAELMLLLIKKLKAGLNEHDKLRGTKGKVTQDSLVMFRVNKKPENS